MSSLVPEETKVIKIQRVFQSVPKLKMVVILVFISIRTKVFSK